MGTWSHEPFGNDQACDWAAELKESSGFSAIEEAFDQVIAGKDEDFIDADVGCIAHAAAEVLVQILGQSTEDLEFLGGVNQWIAKLSEKPSATLIQKGVLALDLLTQENSELDELWLDSDDYVEWVANLDTLKEILHSKL